MTLSPEHIPAEQTAIEVSEPGGPDVLKPATFPVPEPEEYQVLIKVAVAGVNRPDVVQRQGFYPPPPGAPDIPGLEVSGTVVAVGSGVTRWKIGDTLCALLAGGGYAQYAIAEESLCLPIPGDLSLEEAAALPETCFTVWHNLYERANLQAGEWLLVHGGTSGIGTTAIQMATGLGAHVITTAGSDEKCRICEELGAIRAINYHSEEFAPICKELTGKGVNVILDMVGGDYIQRNIKACAPKGRMVNIAFLRGSKVNVDLMTLMLKQLVLTGSTLRSQPLSDKTRIAEGVQNNVWPLIESKKLKPVIYQTFPMNQANEAHKLMESNQHIGKILLVNQ